MSEPTPTSSSSYERSVRLTRRNLQKVLKIIDLCVAKTSTALNVNEAKSALAELNNEYADFRNIVKQGYAAIDRSDAEAAAVAEKEIEDESASMSQAIITATSKVTTFSDAFNGTISRRSLNLNLSDSFVESSAKLPKLNIPVFDGRKEDFLDFAAIFENAVHNEYSLNKVKKLCYLRASCSGEPKELIKDLPLTDAGYDQAWGLIQTRYRDMKSIIRSHFDKLFAIPRIKSSDEIPSLLASIEKSINGFEACGEQPKNWGPILTYMVTERLDAATFRDFEKTLTTNSVFPAFDQLRTFLTNLASIGQRQCDVKVPVKPSASSTPIRNRSPRSSKRGSSLIATDSSSPSKLACPVCKAAHLLIDCADFQAKSPLERFRMLKPKLVCRNCFNTGHKTHDCKKPANCKHCQLPHHSMLHFSSNKPAESSQQPDAAAATIGLSVVPPNSSFLSVRKSPVILPTAVVKYVSGQKTGEMRVLLDSGSQLNLISSSFIARAGISAASSPYMQKVSGVNGSGMSCTRIVTLALESLTETFAFSATFNVIGTPLPYATRNLHLGPSCGELRRYQLADPAYYSSTVNFDDIDALIGIEAYNQCVRCSTAIVGSFYLRDTALGWTVSSAGPPNPNTAAGPPNPQSNASESSMLCCGMATATIDQRLQRFWEIESIPEPTQATMEHVECDKHFESTYKFDENGQFVLKLPFKRDPNCIQGNFDQALAYSRRIENRLSKPVADLYEKFMIEYLELGHMTLIRQPVLHHRHFIPHHAVMKLSSTTTKLRVVFNASAKTKSNVSLNDLLMVGPGIQPELFDTLIRFRRYKQAVTADIAKFYRCILIDAEDRRYQSIVWKAHVYELNTVTYGTGPASFQAAKCLEVLARNIEKTHPSVAYVLRNCFYMDDAMFGADSVLELIELRRLLHETLATVGFDLRKYQSNSRTVLQSIQPELIETKFTKTIGGENSLLILGLAWIPEADSFHLKSSIDTDGQQITKRTILSAVSKLFDPLGFASPVTIRGKLLFQRLWRLSVNWDDPLPSDIIDQFRVYLKDLNNIQSIEFPRFVGCHIDDHIVGFSDASEQAYCAAVYLVSTEENERKAHLYCSKTRVAPVKSLTIPQLELQAATLLCDLVDRVRKIAPVPDDHVHLFTDSTIVLSWLARPPSDWKIFVRNRVSKIVSKFPCEYWSHVPGKLNPADLATRGLTTSQLADTPLWQCGPDFITENEIPHVKVAADDRCDLYRSKQKPSGKVLGHVYADDVLTIESYSSYERLIRCYATVHAAVRRWRLKTVPRSPIHVTVDDLAAAERFVVQVTQRTIFADEYTRLTSPKQRVKRTSRLRQHNPFVDNSGIIRSRTRLQNADYSYDRRNPVILPACSHLTTILIRYTHERYHHATRPFLVTHFSVKYLFIGSISRAVKAVIRQCITCRRYNAQVAPQQMADLPADRVTARSPFEITGVDFAGAFTVKCNHHRTTKFAKAYAAIFVCFSTRAVHIELVPSLSTEDFLSSLKCFISRRGTPTVIYSDNGTNFKGADHYLNVDSNEIRDFADKNRIRWRFNPPYTPHRGGIWESAVKSAKRFLPIVTKGQIFTYNELRVFFTEIEAILNSRPLAYKCEDTSTEILTPGHFLIGRNLTSLPEPDVTSASKVKLTDRYRANRQRIASFWRLWQVDYINQLRSRSKWFDARPNIQSGQVVLYRQPNSAPCSWPRTIIDRTYPDQSGIVRTVRITVDGQSKIVPVHHVVDLRVPVQQSSSDSDSVIANEKHA